MHPAHIVKIVVCVAVMRDMYKTYQHTKELATVQKENQQLHTVLDEAACLVSYLSNKLDEHDVPIDEFDRIVFKNL